MKSSPVKNSTTPKQASLFNFIKKREQKEESKKATVAEICSQNSHKILNSQSKFNKFTEWTKKHEVVKNASPNKQEAITSTKTNKADKLVEKKEIAKKDTAAPNKEVAVKEIPKDKKLPPKKSESN